MLIEIIEKKAYKVKDPHGSIQQTFEDETEANAFVADENLKRIFKKYSSGDKMCFGHFKAAICGTHISDLNIIKESLVNECW